MRGGDEDARARMRDEDDEMQRSRSHVATCTCNGCHQRRYLDGDPSPAASALSAFFDAALAVKPWDVVLSEVHQLGAGAALVEWAKSRGLDVRERHYVTETDAYANVRVNLCNRAERGEATITVLNYRKLSAGEVSAISVKTLERSAERIGYGERLL